MRVALRIMHRPRPAGIGFHDLPLAFMWASPSPGDIEPKFDVTLFCISDFLHSLAYYSQRGEAPRE
jgi:hypothetical protein